MKRYAAIVGGYTIILLSALLPGQKIAAPSPSLPGTSPNRRVEARALWVKSETLTSSAAVIDLVRRAKKNNFTDLVVQVRGRGDAYYNSQIEPRAEDLSNQPGNFDPLALVIDEAHLVGIKIHAWINAYIVANVATLPHTQDHVVFKHPEWVMVPRSVANELYGVDPRSPEYLSRIVEYTRTN